MPNFAEQRPQAPKLPNIHLGLTSDLPEHLAATLGDREDMLSRFAEAPDDPTVWAEVAGHVLDEESRSVGQPEELRDISGQELLAFAGLVRGTEQRRRYGLTAHYAPNGERWFDVLYGFHSAAGDDAIAAAARMVTSELWDAQVTRALDIATGTGKTACVISQFARYTVGLDNDEVLLAAAYADNPTVEFVGGSVDALPFPDESMDIITSDGIKYTLSARTSVAMYHQIARVLRHGGVYIDSHYAAADEIRVSTGRSLVLADYHPENLGTFVTWRAVLEDMIVDTVSGKWNVDAHLPLWGQEWEQLKHDLGLREVQLHAHPLAQNQFSHARLLYKQ